MGKVQIAQMLDYKEGTALFSNPIFLLQDSGSRFARPE